MLISVSLAIKTLLLSSTISSAKVCPKILFLIESFCCNLNLPALVKSYLRLSNKIPLINFEAPSLVAVSPCLIFL
ncbi:Uncharacterised protein [Mycoplasma putrefaciens]|nr:Uncharacterised protein [Mycoplasma putrefaciens]